MSNEIDVIVLDLDGTLLRNDKTVSVRTLEVLKQCEQQGIQIVIATARPPRLGAVRLPELLQREFMIFYNGSEIIHNGKRIYCNWIGLNSLEQIRQLLLKQHTPRASFEIEDRLYTNYDITGFFGNIEHEKIELAQFELKPAAKVLVDMSSVDDPVEFSASLPEDCQLIVTDNGTLGHVMTAGISKLTALTHILELLGTSLARVVFFGDDTNDIELISTCGTGVAMGNADSAVKAVASYMTGDNEHDGIAEFLERYLRIS